MSVALSTELRVKAWNQKGMDELVLDSKFYQLSNRANTTETPANPKDISKLPSNVMISVGDKLETGRTSITLPWYSELSQGFRMGMQKEEGNEESISIKPFTAYYNVDRKSTNVGDISVDGDAEEFWGIASKAKDRLFAYIGKLFDYHCHRALCEGAGLNLTDSTAWTGATFSSAPVSVALHPKIFVTGGTDFVTWNNTYSTYETSLQSAAGALTPSSSMTIAKVFEIGRIASRTVAPLGWSFAGQQVDWILLVSHVQSYQIANDATAISGLIDRTRMGDERGFKNRALTGIVGVWGGVLVVEDPRAAIYNQSGTAGSRFGYYRPDVSVNANPTRTAHGNGAATGTCEIATLLGNKALVETEMVSPKIITKMSTDYEATKDMAIMAKWGVQRPDFRASTDTSRPSNESSFLYFTATPSGQYLG